MLRSTKLAEDHDVSVVHICTPNHAHFEQASRMLRAGKHVLCEKPLAMDSRESEMLVKLARERGAWEVSLTTSVTTRYATKQGPP